MNPVFKGGREPADDKPIMIDDPTTGFHPDQLTSYPLQRVGNTLYVAYIEAITAGNGDSAILIDANQMDAYPYGDPSGDDFYDAPVEYAALDPAKRKGIPEAPYRGRGELIIEDFSTYDGEVGETLDNDGVVSVLMAPVTEDELDSVRRKLDGGRFSVRVLPEQPT